MNRGERPLTDMLVREYISLILPPPTKKESADFIKVVLSPLEKAIFKEISDPDYISPILMKTKKRFDDKFTPISRPALCCLYISTFAESILKLSKEHLDKDDLHMYVLYYDYGQGASSVALSIIAAEESIRKGDDWITKSVLEITEVLRPEGLNLIDQTGLMSDVKKVQENLVKALIEDHSGLKALEEYTGLLEDTLASRRRVTNVPQFVMAGAKFAKEMYRAIYPISGDLYSQ